MMASPLNFYFIFAQQLGTDGARVYTTGVKTKARASLTLNMAVNSHSLLPLKGFYS